MAIPALAGLIASDLPVFRELVGAVDERLLFPRDDAAALAARMREWAEVGRAERDAVGARGRAHVEAHHEHARWEHGLRALYREVAGDLAADAA